jgi:hypothetical protein
MEAQNMIIGAQESLVSLEELFTRVIDDIEDAEGLGLYETRSREGIFAPALVMWLTMSQKMRGRGSLMSALESLSRGECELIRSRNSKGRRREAALSTGQAGEMYRWRGRLVVLVDGTTVQLARSEEMLLEYQPVENQHRQAHFPQVICLCAHELFSSVALPPVFGPYRGLKPASEMALYKVLVKDLPKDSLVVFDRLYGNITSIYATQQYGHQVIVRLPRPVAKSLAGEKFGSEDLDLPVTWKAGRANRKLFLKNAQVSGRLLQHTVKRKGFREMTLWFFTDSAEPAGDLLALYLQRERIENDIRSLKYLLGMEILSARSPDTVAKELLLTYAAYNLMRAVIAKAAKTLGVEPRRISFSRAARLTQIFGNKLRDATSNQERSAIVKAYLRGLNQSKIANRKTQRIEPRKCCAHKSRFPAMKGTRQQERQIALQTAKQFGHRGYFTTVTRKY